MPPNLLPNGESLSDSSYAIGIDLGGSSVKAVAVTPSGETLRQAIIPFDASTQMDWAARIKEVICEVQVLQGVPAESIGLSAPGLASRDGRSIAYMPGRLKGLAGLNWTAYLKARHPVPVLNDAHAALLGEAWLGAARGYENVIMLTLGTGVGGAAIVDGRLLRGHTGKAGHLGHTCLDIEGPPDVCGIPGSLEMAIGNCTIIERSEGKFQTTHDLIEAQEAGNTDAANIWMKSMRALACAIGSFTNILDPEAVIIGGGIAKAGDTLFVPLRELVGRVEWKVRGHDVKILPAILGELAGAYGAAWKALQVGA
jgi:glucokinase